MDKVGDLGRVWSRAAEQRHAAVGTGMRLKLAACSEP